MCLWNCKPLHSRYSVLREAAGGLISVVSNATLKGTHKMTTTKIAALALTAVIGLGAVATPVLASSNVGVSDKFDSAFYIQQLRYDGIDAVSAQDVGNDNFQALVIGADGHSSYLTFNENTFALVK